MKSLYSLTFFLYLISYSTLLRAQNISQNSLAKKIDSATSASPYSLLNADFDGDGKLDLAIVNGGYPYSLSIFRNISNVGSPGFAAKIDFPTGVVPFDIAAADLNRDGKTDIIVANSGVGSNTISVLLNTSSPGIISFISVGQFSTGADPISIATGDLDGDGKIDIVVSNYSSNTISVFRNTSVGATISFSPKNDYAVNTLPRKVVVADIDGDGKSEIIVSNSGSNNISIFKNNSSFGTISFATKTDYVVGNNPEDIVVTDLDGDGKLEIAVANSVSGEISLFRNTSVSGLINFAAKIDLPQPAGSIAITTADIDGDGRKDLAVANQSGNWISLIRNTSFSGNLVFDTAVYYSTGLSPYNICAGDLDGDGKPDLVTVNQEDNTISIFKNTFNAARINDFSPAFGGDSTMVTINGTHFSGATSVMIGGTAALSFTVVSDTKITTMVGSGSTGNITVNTPTGLATLATFTYFPKPMISNCTPLSAAAGNIVTITGSNFSGATAVSFGGTPADSFYIVSPSVIIAVVGHGASGSVLVTTPGGSAIIGGFTYTSVTPVITSLIPSSGSIGSTINIHGAGFNALPSKNIVYFGPVRATVISGNSNDLQVTVPAGATLQPLTVTTNGLTAYGSQPFNVTYSDTGLPFSAASFGPSNDFPTGISSSGICAGDLDGDGKSDLIVANLGNTAALGHCLSILKNTGTIGHISFAPKVEFYAPNSFYWFSNVAVGDFNGDGKLDIAASVGGNNNVFVYLNKSVPGSIILADPILLTVGSSPVNIAIMDLDGDGKSDIVVANEDWNSVSILQNISTIDTLSFLPQALYNTGNLPMGVALGDLDGDGKPDISVANDGRYANSVSVLRNTSAIGQISYATNTDYPLAANSFPKNTYIGDIDGDGKPELISSNYNSNTISVFPNHSNIGAFNFGTRMDFIYGNVDVHLANMDGDGKPDAIFTNGPGVSLLRNLSVPGSIAFDSVKYFLNGTGSTANLEVDLDGDGKSDLVVLNSNAGTVSIARNLTGSGALPVITSFTPDSASTGSTVQIKGVHMTGIQNVNFGGVPAENFSIVSDSVILATIGSGFTGNLMISNGSGIAIDSGFVFTGALISSFAPASAGSSTTITIIGSHLRGATAVNFGGTPALHFTVVSDSVIYAVVDSGSSGDVSIITPRGAAALSGFTFIKPGNPVPSIFSFSPSSGNPGSIILIKGTHFTESNTVNFGGIGSQSFTVLSDTTIQATVGSGASGAVLVATSFGVDSLPGFVFIKAPQPPAIFSFQPSSGASSAKILIKGSNFTGTNAVKLGDVNAQSFTVLSDSTIQAIVGTGASGVVTVSTSLGIDSLSGFVFIQSSQLPVIYSFQPDSGKSGTIVTISGINFTGTNAIFFGGQPASSFQVINDSSITATVGQGASGAVRVVTSIGFMALNAFTFVDTIPKIDSVLSQPNTPIIVPTLNITSQGNNAFLNWQMSHDQRIASFTIEKSLDSISFNYLATVSNSPDTGVTRYAYSDTLVNSSTVYYRIHLNSDTLILYSNVVEFTSPLTSNKFKVYPNPASKYIDVEYPATNNIGEIKLFDSMGRKVQGMKTEPNSSKARLQFSGNLNGLYRVVWSDGTKNYSGNLLIQ